MFTIKLQTRDHVQIALSSAAFAVASMIFVLLIDWNTLKHLSGDYYRTNLFNDIFIPLVIAFPSFYVMLWKIIQLGKAKKILEELAYTDSLTGALNRRAFQARVEQLLSNGKNGGFAMMVIDLDHFKAINDSLGHDIGDQALIAVADTVSNTALPDALFGRIGGEEFVLFMARTNSSVAMLAAEQMRIAIQNSRFGAVECSGRVTTSIGVAIAERSCSFMELYREADVCLYKAKAAGRNRVIHTILASTASKAGPDHHHSYAI